MLSRTLAALAFAIASASAHGYIKEIRVGSTKYPGWDVQNDPYRTPQPLKVVRPTPKDSGFVANPSSNDIACSTGTALKPPGPIYANVTAGDTVTVVWNSWPKGHFGPIMDYMAKCSGSCSSWSGNGNQWFKIAQSTFENGVWANDRLAASLTWDVVIPKQIAPGEYILRHEPLALHGGGNLGGAQFYPVCIQLMVSSDGNATASGVAFPGAYKASDPGIHFSPYGGNSANMAYIAPGGPVTKFS